MCGIAGIVTATPADAPRKSLKQMLSHLRERGPENEDCWSNDNVHLGHTRLSIVDLSTDANQPMSNEDGSLVIVFNGEIFNYKELRRELQGLKHSFRTNSDTEVLLNGYLEWGMKMLLSKTNGMYAFALHDLRNKTLVLVRDVFGEKPLYYFKNKDRLLFSSSINSIWEQEREGLTLNMNSLDYYLSELSSPQPNTIWKEIFQVKPAHCLTVDVETLETTEGRYWSLDGNDLFNGTFEEALTQSEKEIILAIQNRSVSDVPIAAFLSGGVDSGLVVSILGERMGKKLKTFTISFHDDKFGEHTHAEGLAKKYDTDHQTIFLESDILSDLPDIIDYVGEPFADASILPTYHIARAISKEVKVVMSGDGGDEFFGGYNEYGLAFNARKFDEDNPYSLLKKAKILLSKAGSRITNSIPNFGSFDHYNSLAGDQRLSRHMGFSLAQKRRLYESEFFRVHGLFSSTYLLDIWNSVKKENPVDQLMTASLSTRLLNDYLVKIDRASMMNSLEVRSPFLDRRLAEFTNSLPSNIKFYKGRQKALLLTLAAKRINNDVYNRPKKGFEVPLRKWIIEQKEWVREIILDGVAKRDFFRAKEVETMLSDHLFKKSDCTHRIWALICLELWIQKYL